jgi:hypothetical protein
MNDEAPVLKSLGISLNSGFPCETYDSLSSQLGIATLMGLPAWKQFAGAWNAVAYRYKACAEHNVAFTESFKRSSAPPSQPERYIQERELFGFFSTGFSAMEASYYALFAIASLHNPSNFRLSTDEHFRVTTVGRIARAFSNYFPGKAFTSTILRIYLSKEYNDWKEAREVLNHRGQPGRTACVGSDRDGRTLWQLCDISIDLRTTSSRWHWLSQTINDLVGCAADFCDENSFP